MEFHELIMDVYGQGEIMHGESSPKKDVQEALILMTTDAVHVVY